jgi:hypothetical protein
MGAKEEKTNKSLIDFLVAVAHIFHALYFFDIKKKVGMRMTFRA